MNKKKVKEYVSKYKENGCCVGPCFIEGLIYSKAVYAASLCNNCKFSLGNEYAAQMLCDILNDRLALN